MLSGRSFRSTFVFSINSLMAFFRPFLIQLKPHYLLFLGLMLSCVQLPKNITKCLLFTFIYYSDFWYSFCNQPVLFAQLENVSKLRNNHRTEHLNEQNQNKNKTKSCHIQLDHAFCCSVQPLNNGIVSFKEWLHWLMSQSKGRFLVNNILMFGSA